MPDNPNLSAFPFPLPPPDRENATDLKEILMRVEREYIRHAYAVHGNIRKAAASLCMDAATYLRRKRKYDAD
jgi:transcriptional regulator with PAS, ATPase and Fis domain